MWDDVLAWEEEYGGEWDGLVVAVNDVGAVWPRPLDHWASLHADKFPRWIAERRRAYGDEPPFCTWGRRETDPADRCLVPWPGGSSGLFGAQVAREVGCRRVVLCGIPMTPTAHFLESLEHDAARPWVDAAGHWLSWERMAYKLRGWLKSMSGRTRELLGAPTREWLEAPDAGGGDEA